MDSAVQNSVRDLRELVSEAAHDAVRAKVTGMLADGAVVTGLRMRRASLKPRHGLRAAYTVRVRSAAGSPAAKRYLSVFWQIDRAEGLSAPPPAPLLGSPRSPRAKSLAAGPDPDIPPALVAPFRSLRVTDPELGVDIQAWPYDPAMPLLALAADPQFAPTLMAPPAAATGSRGAWTVTPVRYVPGRTHVLRYDPAAALGSPGPGTVFAKLYGSGSHPGLLREAMTMAVAGFAEGGETAALNSPFPETNLGGLLLFPWVEGASLASRLVEPDAGVDAVLVALGNTVAALHALPPHPGLPERSLAWVIRGTARAAPWLDLLAPAEAGRFGRLLEAATAAGDRGAAEPGVLSHGDLKAEHAMVSRAGRLSLIDLDSLARAEPALDLGMLLGDLRWKCLPRGDAFVAAAQERFLDGYRARAGLPPDRLRRARTFELASFLRTVARRVGFWQPSWEAELAASLDTAERLARE